MNSARRMQRVACPNGRQPRGSPTSPTRRSSHRWGCCSRPPPRAGWYGWPTRRRGRGCPRGPRQAPVAEDRRGARAPRARPPRAGRVLPGTAPELRAVTRLVADRPLRLARRASRHRGDPVRRGRKLRGTRCQRGQPARLASRRQCPGCQPHPHPHPLSPRPEKAAARSAATAADRSASAGC